jgi:hypothetical protein
MRIANALILGITGCGLTAAGWGQTQPIAASGPGAPAAMSRPAPAPSPAAAPLPVGPSTVLQPALNAVQVTLNQTRMERWKKGSVRDEASTDIGSILNDIQINLPPLMKDADASPGMVSKSIPVAKNVDALYDVLLRVVESARMAAPDDQANALRQTLGTLNSARLTLYDKMQDAASTQEKQVADLRATVQKQAAFKCPAPPPPEPCKPTTPAKKPVKKATKPAAGTPAAGGTTPKTGP